MSNTKEDNNLILNLIKQVKSIGYQLTALQSSPGILRKDEFEYTGSQVFTTTENYAQVFVVAVKGVGPLSETQYTLTPPNTVTVLDTLEPTDFVVIIYSQTLSSTLPYYTQAEIDALLLALENSLKDYTNDSFVRGAKLYARTGIVDKTDQFKLEVFDADTITIGAVDNALFWDKLFEIDVDPNSAIRSFTELPYNLTELITATGLNTNTNPIVSDGIYVRYLGYDIQGGVVSSPSSFIENSAVVQLGFTTVVKSGASITFLGGTTPGARNVFSQPILANLNDLDRITVNTATDITVGYNIGTPTLNTNPGIITGISINWRSLSNPTNSSSVDKYNYLGDNIVDFVSIDANFLTDTSAPVIHTLWTDLAEGVVINKSFYNTTTTLRDTLDVGSYSVKRVLVGVRGGVFIQDGEHATSAGYTTLDIAKANVYTHSFTNAIVPEGLVIEIARIIFKESVTDFSDETQFIIVGTIGGTSSGGSLVTVGDATPTVKGVLKLAGDLAGTANLPTVPALLTKADDSTVVHLLGTETIDGSKTFSSLVTAAGYKIPLGTASQFLKADGSIDSTVYSTTVGTVTSIAALTLGTTGTDLSSSVVNSTTTPVITLNVPTASALNRGALSSIDWTTFNNKQPQLNGTGFIKAVGTVISYDNTTYQPSLGYTAANDSLVMHLSGNETFTGTKSFTGINGLTLTNNTASSQVMTINNTSTGTGLSVISANGIGISSFATTGPAIQLANNPGNSNTLLNIISGGGIATKMNLSGSSNGLVIDNSTTATGKPFSYTKNNVEKAFLNDAGTFSAQTIIKAGGLGTQFLMADGTVSTGASPSLVTNIQSGTTYTLLSTDNGLQIIFTNAAAITLTIPSGLPSGFNCEILQQGTGQISFVGSGTTLRVSSFETLFTSEKYALVGIDNMPNLTEEYHLYGALQNI